MTCPNVDEAGYSQEYACCRCNVKFPSICSIHKHLVVVEQVRKYIVNVEKHEIKILELYDDRDISYKRMCADAIITKNRHFDVPHFDNSIRSGENKDQSSLTNSSDKVQTENAYIYSAPTTRTSVPEQLKGILKVATDPESKATLSENDGNCIQDHGDDGCVGNDIATNDVKSDDESVPFNIRKLATQDEYIKDIGQQTSVTSENKVNDTHNHRIKQGTAPSSQLQVPCDRCGLLFKKRNLKRHRQSHNLVKIFKCDICFKEFKTKSMLYGHKLHHRTIRDHICDTCGKCFNNGPNLRQHKRSHSSVRPHACLLCPKMFKSKTSLHEHIQRHSDNKPYACRVCHRSFRKEYEMKRHMVAHTDERPHVCVVCRRTFKTRANRIKHEKTHNKAAS